MVTFGNGTTTSHGYGAQATQTALAHNLAGTAQDVAFAYAPNQVRDIASHSWNNDLYQWRGYGNGSRNATPNGLNQYASVAGVALGYDLNGNLASDGVWTYGYDLDNRLKSAGRSGLAAALAYDGAGRLRQTTIAGVATQLLYDGTDLVAEYDGAGALLRRYVHGPGVDEPVVWYEGAGTANKNWLYADHLGSVVATANAAGTATSTLSYGPYGEPNQGAGVRFRYTGQQLLGQLNLYYYKARMYSPALGRFLQADPIGYADDLNLYAYVRGNPISYSDPQGLQSVPAVIVTGGIITAGILYYSPAGKAIRDGFAKAVHSVVKAYSEAQAAVQNWMENGAKSPPDVRPPSGTNSGGQKGDREGSGFPDRELPRDPNGNPVRDPEAEGAHTQLGQKEGRRGKYDQRREWNANGRPVKDIDFTDHGRPQNHTNPHEHPYLPNPTGGTPQHGPARPLQK